MKTQAHTVYKTKDGIIVPSVTTVLNLLNKPQLIDWAWNLGIEGKDYKKVRDETASVGTLTHKMILNHFKNQKTDTSEYSKEIIEKAENSFLSFLEWEKGKKIETIFVEKEGVSEQYGFGGTIDFYGKINGILTIADWKTGKGLYSEYVIQLSAYRWLLTENGFNADRVLLVRINREENEEFEEKEKVETYKEFEIFKHLLEIYRLQKEIK